MIARDAAQNEELLTAFSRNHLRFDGTPFAGLVSPSSTLISEECRREVTAHVRAVAAWHAGVQRIYADLLTTGDEQHPLLRMMEWGLDEYAVRLQRASALREDRPTLGRLDCVRLGGAHAISEVQWKGAGEGWLASIDRSYREIFPLAAGERPFGDLVEAWARVFPRDGCSINTGRAVWADAEVFLNGELRQRGVRVVFSPAREISNAVELDGSTLRVRGIDAPNDALRYLFLDRLTEVLGANVLDPLVEAYVDGTVALDPPPSYLYNQKLPQALPFSSEHRSHFPDSVREAFIPSVLITDAPPALEPIAAQLDGDGARVAEISSWDELPSLPAAIREKIVVKCGSSHQFDNHGGHGVFRLGGTEEAARTILDRVLARVAEGEPWIVQPFMGARWDVPIAHPSRPFKMREASLYAKFGVYFRLPARAGGEQPEVLGGVASLGTSWKVSGASGTPSRIDEGGSLVGAFRHDIRVGSRPTLDAAGSGGMQLHEGSGS